MLVHRKWERIWGHGRQKSRGSDLQEKKGEGPSIGVSKNRVKRPRREALEVRKPACLVSESPFPQVPGKQGIKGSQEMQVRRADRNGWKAYRRVKLKGGEKKGIRKFFDRPREGGLVVLLVTERGGAMKITTGGELLKEKGETNVKGEC